MYTLGCKVSLYESEAIGESFAAAGYEVCAFDEVCDVYVINTCTVTAESDAKSRKYIRRAIRKNPEAVVIVIGCYSQRAPGEVAAIEGVSAVLGTADKMKCVEIAQRLLNAECEQIKTVDNCFYRSAAARGCKKSVDNGFPPERDRAAARRECAETRSKGSRVYRGEQYDYVSRGRMQNAELAFPVGEAKRPEGIEWQSGGLADPEGDRAAARGGSRRLTDEVSIADSSHTYEKNESAEVYTDTLEGAEFEPMCVKNAPRTRAYVKIEDGCECKCSYCAISAARGPVRSKRPEDVIAEVEGLYKNGTLEIVLTGIETGSYGADFDEKYDLADLICELDRRHSCGRIRLGSMAPELLTPKFTDRVSATEIMVPHFHISMQSGADNVLRGMRRRYNRAMALKNIAHIRERMPDVMLTADLMVGFPGESEEDFLDTLRFVREAELLDAHVFAYSKREGTPAATMNGQVDERVKKERSARLMAECRAMRDEILDRVCESGRPLACILETEKRGVYTAHSDSYIEVSVEGERGLSGSLVLVNPVSHKDGVIFGKII